LAWLKQLAHLGSQSHHRRILDCRHTCRRLVVQRHILQATSENMWHSHDTRQLSHYSSYLPNTICRSLRLYDDPNV